MSAYKIAQISTASRDDALDIVQDAMIKFSEKYTHKPESEWRPLFYRVVNNRIIDWHRRKKTRASIFSLVDHDVDMNVSAAPSPESQQQAEKATIVLDEAIRSLPMRQQQAVLLRIWDGMSTAETATAMGVGAGSVKTHLSRGLKALQSVLGVHWP